MKCKIYFHLKTTPWTTDNSPVLFLLGPGPTGFASSGAFGGGGLPTFDLGCPGDLMPLIRSSVAPSTWRAYGKAWEEWCLLADGKPVGSSDDVRMQMECDPASGLWVTHTSIGQLVVLNCAQEGDPWVLMMST
ncbi:uncharacterized protein LOC143764733 isoform X3 [Ranitomeya variabilis]|uniref:uncharacterized protein LOC143764733 isoform X3 n=1 Tax=Ranitomeya variabilis TaxID=490064 RepID=UPI004057148E